MPFDFENPPVQDGDERHRSVPPQRWCVTREDLVQLRSLVSRRVAAQRLQPTEWDRFDPRDDVIGPCIATINIQLIKPVTAKAGNVSWALMLHPEGLECDVFVTHCWQEGIYEFIDKVLNSWPRRARTAYCCMLSNPQNLDISSLISSPKDSPFAHALQASKWMLAVPNQTCSIYSRVWCAYEAFCAYSESKLIFTASAPVRGLWRSICPVLATNAVMIAVSVTAHAQLTVKDWAEYDDYPIPGQSYVNYLLFLLSFALLILADSMRSTAPSTGIILHVCASISAVFLGYVSCKAVVMFSTDWRLGQVSSDSRTNDVARVYVASLVSVGTILGYAGRVRRIGFNAESLALRRGYTGKLHDAQASFPEDRQFIIEELAASGHEAAVDEAVEILLHSGMSTPALRTAVHNCGPLLNAGYWSLSMTSVMWLMCTIPAWCTIGVAAEVYSLCASQCRVASDKLASSPTCLSPCTFPLARWDVVMSIFGMLVFVAWLALFCLQRPDSRGFAAKALIRIAGGSAVFIWLFPLLLAKLSVYKNPAGILVFYGLVSPFVLAVSIAGPGLTSRVPWFGPRLVRFLFKKLAHRSDAGDGSTGALGDKAVVADGAEQEEEEIEVVA